jgi:hypothetical protein
MHSNLGNMADTDDSWIQLQDIDVITIRRVSARCRSDEIGDSSVDDDVMKPISLDDLREDKVSF